MREMSTSYGGFGEAELKRLQPRDRMIKCVSRTPTLGKIFLGMRYDATEDMADEARRYCKFSVWFVHPVRQAENLLFPAVSGPTSGTPCVLWYRDYKPYRLNPPPIPSTVSSRRGTHTVFAPHSPDPYSGRPAAHTAYWRDRVAPIETRLGC